MLFSFLISISILFYRLLFQLFWSCNALDWVCVRVWESVCEFACVRAIMCLMWTAKCASYTLITICNFLSNVSPMRRQWRQKFQSVHAQPSNASQTNEFYIMHSKWSAMDCGLWLSFLPFSRLSVSIHKLLLFFNSFAVRMKFIRFLIDNFPSAFSK